MACSILLQVGQIFDFCANFDMLTIMQDILKFKKTISQILLILGQKTFQGAFISSLKKQRSNTHTKNVLLQKLHFFIFKCNENFNPPKTLFFFLTQRTQKGIFDKTVYGHLSFVCIFKTNYLYKIYKNLTVEETKIEKKNIFLKKFLIVPRVLEGSLSVRGFYFMYCSVQYLT